MKMKKFLIGGVAVLSIGLAGVAVAQNDPPAQHKASAAVSESVEAAPVASPATTDTEILGNGTVIHNTATSRPTDAPVVATPVAQSQEPASTPDPTPVPETSSTDTHPPVPGEADTTLCMDNHGQIACSTH